MDELPTPDFEGNYQKLLATLKAQANYVPTSIWMLIATGRWDEDRDEMERQRAYCENISTLPFWLLYFDLPDVEPLLARAFVLARLLADNAPVAYLREELNSAVADVIEARGDETAAKAPVLLFTDRMQVEPTTAQVDVPIPSAPAFDLARWSQALERKIWGTA